MNLQSILYDLQGVAQIFLEGGSDLINMFALVILLELPLSLVAITGMISWYRRYNHQGPLKIQPNLSCIITCYGEGADIKKTIISLCEQSYKGHIEIIAVIDGAIQNDDTYQAALESQDYLEKFPHRSLLILPKWQRGGRVSTLNAGLEYASGEIIMNADGDTSFDNDMAVEIIKAFEDPNVPAVGGSLRVRNMHDGLATRMQTLEYMISIQGNKTGLAEWNLINNISGAFGAFRRDFLQQIGGWDTHTAEDLDLTVRMKQYFGRHPKMRLSFVPLAIGHTDVPANFKELFSQRLRWDGDLVFLYLRKHRYAFNPRLVGWKTLIYTGLYGIVQNVILPVLILLFNAMVFTNLDGNTIAVVLIAQYLLYLVYALVHYSLFLYIVSERKRQDSKALLWLPLYPIYGLVMKLVSVFSTLNELLRRGHEESNMAPWWVLSKGKRF
ncbi:MAG: glycosyltransferase family 2 protein [Oleispira sp.]|nr:glycosyltransferase family 2 protein [Oleispira sp.]MBL4880357.1 glycosyltransferase family 2 protein [Oleispira sp.]